MSNNSAANSEESNDESQADKHLDQLNTNNSKTLGIQKTEENETNEKNDENILQKDLEFDFVSYATNIEETIKIESEHKNRNLIQNFKRFFSQKFSLGNNDNEDLTYSESKKSEKISKLVKNNSMEAFSPNLNSIERYKQIIEDHKDLLPENFTIRQFPFSSCQDTFQASETESCNKSRDKLLDIISTTSSSSLSPSPINQYFPTCPNSTNDIRDNEIENKNLNHTNKTEADLNEDSTNSLNKRYYHVFRRNELDNLIKECAPNLIIYESYYDHGNWSICARKEK